MKAEEAVVEDISQLVSHSGNPTETLIGIVNLIQQRFTTDVCSVYVLEQDRANLVLAATVGLRPESVGQVRMSSSRCGIRTGDRWCASTVRSQRKCADRS